ncbi:MAG TPA: DUF222 domain-containing protein [Acidimicrobiia bacterium]|nr:DUF222 domain-containing protein [Acidimicrobiia bacterium]
MLPEGLADLKPGAALAAHLETIDRSSLNGHELVTLLQARVRQISHLQAAMYADIWEIGHAPGGFADSPPERSSTLDEFASDELAAALSMTSRTADGQLSLAYLLSRLPQVREAFEQGTIDLIRARVFCNETSHLDDPEAQAVVDPLVDHAAALTPGRLGARLRRRCMEVDPEASRRRYEESVRERHLESRSNPDGTGDIVGRHLPIDRVANIYRRIDALARRLRKHTGRTIDQIRADIFMDLLEGKETHVARGRGGVEIRVDLTTLLELDESAGELEGWGPIISDLARRVVADQHDGRWDFVVTDPETGEPIWTGTTRRRPTAAQKRHVRARNPYCVFPGCSRPAIWGHLDHTVEHSRGGPTHVGNLGPLCGRHHLRTKHRAGWRLYQPQPGVFIWISPRGHRYEVRPPPP